MKASYLWNRVLKKIRGTAVLNSRIEKTSKVEAGTQFINSTMDRYSFCGYDCKILNCDIGAFCSIADGVAIGLAQHPFTWGSTSPVFYEGRDSVKKKFSNFKRETSPRSTIGNDVWIGERVSIKGGVIVGDGAIIGMGSVVTHDVPPYAVVAGVPAKLIRYRFNDELIKAYLRIKWWEKDDEVIQRAAKKITDPKSFAEEFE